MTTEQELVVIGRAAKEYAEARKKLVFLQAHAKSIGDDLCTLGEALRRAPSTLSVTGGVIEVAGEKKDIIGFNDLNAENIATLIKDLQRTNEEFAALTAKLKDLGVLS